MSIPSASVGRVFLVGAGPGDPGLVTWRGIQCLQQADVVLYDYLVNPRILAHSRPGTEKICLGQHGRTRIWTQAEIHEALVRFARSGKTVVRLKGGDPAVFARVGEETQALQGAGIPFEVVPGITAALAVGSYCGIPLTYRGISSAVALVTGHEESDKPDLALDYQGLAKFPGTLVFYMGVTTIQQWTEALIHAGKPAETPVAIVRRCSLPDQLVIRCRLSEAADRMEHLKMRPPAIVIVGPVAALAPEASWFATRPLAGRRIVVTRPADQADQLGAPLEALGAEVYLQPAIEIGPPETYDPVDSALKRLREFDWLVFSSANGVRHLIERLFQLGLDVRAFGSLRLAAIGPGTADELERYHLRADLVPGEYRAEALAESLAEAGEGKRYLLVRASRGREALAETLRAAGAVVEQIVVYSSADVSRPDPEIESLVSAGRIDWITVTSSAIARSLAKMFGDRLQRVKLASMSPITSATLRELGLQPAAEARIYTMAGVVDAIVSHEVQQAP